MIRKLQLKFVAVCMTLVMVVLGAVLVSIFLSARQNLEVLSHQVLQRVIREDTSHGTVPSQQPDLGLDIGGKEVVLPYFTVVLWEDRSWQLYRLCHRRHVQQPPGDRGAEHRAAGVPDPEAGGGDPAHL